MSKILSNVAQLCIWFYAVLRLHLIGPMDFWCGSFLCDKKFAILEDALKNKDEPKPSTHSKTHSAILIDPNNINPKKGVGAKFVQCMLPNLLCDIFSEGNLAL